MLAWFRLCLCLLWGLSLLVPSKALAATPLQHNYPDADKPCLSGDPQDPRSSYGKTSGSGYWCAGYAWGNIGGSEYSARGYGYRNCTDWAAFRANELTGLGVPRNLGNANTWDNNAPAAWTKDDSPEPGDIAQTDAGTYGHVGVVEEVKRTSDGTISSITVSAYNARQDGVYGTEVSVSGGGGFTRPGGGQWGVFLDMNGAGKGIDGKALTDSYTPMNNTVLEVVKRNQSDGVNLVYWAKAGNVFESWWRPGSDGIHIANLISITQQDVTAIDADIRPDGQHLLYTATAHNVWETWWYPGKAKHTAPIIQKAGNIRKIQKTTGPDGSQQLYVMTDQGVDEYWWRPGGSIHRGRIYSLAQPKAFKKMRAPDGMQMIAIADQGYGYEASWRSDGVVHIRQMMHITQRDITTLDAVVDADGQRRMYVGRQRDGIWEAVWKEGQLPRSRMIAGGQGIRAVVFYHNGAVPTVCVATTGGVFEYWWLPDDPRVRSGVITALADVHDIDRGMAAHGAQAIYTAANTRVFESWWYPGGNGIQTKPVA